MTTPHRYWRFYITASASTVCPFSSAVMATLPGGANLLTDKTKAYASSIYGGGYEASQALNGLAAFWHPNNGGLPQWWAYDFGAGNEKDITEVGMSACPDGNYAQSPSGVTVQYSDDNVTWADSWSYSTTWTGPTQAQLFDKPGAVAAPPSPVKVLPLARRYWGVRSLLSGSSVYSYNRIQLQESSGGANLATDPSKAQATNSGGGQSPGNAIVGGGGQACYTSGVSGSVWLYDFGSPVEIDTATLTARTGTGDSGQTPTLFDLVGSDDGAVIDTYAHLSTTSWGSEETRSFNFQGAIAAAPPSLQSAPVLVTKNRYWGLRSVSVNSSVYSYNRIQLEGTAGGPNLATDPTKAQATNVLGGFSPGNAVTGAGGQACYVSGASGSIWLYDFGSPVEIDTATITARNAGDQSQTPIVFDLIGSSDGVTYAQYTHVVTPSWGDGETRSFVYQAASGNSVPTPVPQPPLAPVTSSATVIRRRCLPIWRRTEQLLEVERQRRRGSFQPDPFTGLR